MNKIIFVLIFAVSQNLWASDFTFEVYSNSMGSNSIAITSESEFPFLYLVTRNEGSMAPKNCDQGVLVVNFRDSISSIVKIDTTASVETKYAYRFCVYARNATGGQRLVHTETFLKN